MTEKPKNITFIVKNPAKLNEVEEIVVNICLDFSTIKCYFEFEFKDNLLNYCNELSQDFQKSIDKSHENKNPAFAYWTNDIIFIDDSFWDGGRDNEEKRCIIIHELGHIKYPFGSHLHRGCHFLYRKDTRTYLEAEYLANKYIMEVDKDNKLIQTQCGVWLRDYKQGLDKSLEKSNKHKKHEIFYALVQNYFILSGFQALTGDSTIKRYISLIYNRFLELGIPNKDINDFSNLIGDYLNDCYDGNKRKKLEEVYNRIDEKTLNTPFFQNN